MSLSFDPNGWEAALTISADPSYSQPRTAQTQTSNALQSMQPVESGAPSEWSDFWKGTAQTVLGYVLAKDAAQTRADMATQAAQTQRGYDVATAAAQPRPAGAGLLPLLLIGGLVYLVLKD